MVRHDGMCKECVQAWLSSVRILWMGAGAPTASAVEHYPDMAGAPTMCDES